ncbi:MAG: penicillin acylase family protein [Gemmatimonadota bacterium]
MPPLVLTLSAVACGGPETASPANFQELAEASLISVEGERTLPGLHGEVEVLRDPWGIAHIYAESREDLFFAQGYVQAQDRLWQMDMWRRVNEGRLAEILGPEAFEHDRLARLLLYRGSWEEEWEVYHPEGEMIFRRFAEGVNALIHELGDDLPVEYRLTGLTPLPWTPQASTGRVATALPLSAARAELNLARRVAELGVDEVDRVERPRHGNWIDLVVPDGMNPSLIQAEAVEALSHFRGDMPRPPLLPIYEGWAEAEASENMGAQEDAPGSNNWVVSPRLSATGQVLLANDPHRGVTNPSLRYLIHLNVPGYSVIGSTEPAIPGVAIGHNGKVAWGLTIVGTDQADVFLERINSDNPNQVWEDGAWVPLRLVVDTIAVKGEAPRIVTHRFSRNGPIFHVDAENHLAYTVRSTSTEPGTGGYLAALRLADASDCGDFMDSMAYYFAPSENMICGDSDGNIAWLAAALTPNRVGGWFGRLPVPGWGEYGWDGFRPHTELPQEFNPERGWIGTANHDVQPPGYFPPLMFRPGPFSRWDRLQAMFDGASALTRDEMQRMILDANHPWVPRDRSLFTGWSASDGEVEWARAALEGWDGVFHRDRVEPALYNAWESHMPALPRNRETTEAALTQALESLTERLGEDRSQWRWGRIHRSEFPHLLVRGYDLPSVERHGGGGTTAATGATFRQIIDFSDLDGSLATSTPGQSMQPGSRFYGNLLPMWGEGEFFPLLFSQSAVKEEAEVLLRLSPGG